MRPRTPHRPDEDVLDANRFWFQSDHHRRPDPERSSGWSSLRLDVAIKVLKKVDDIGFCYLTSSDVVRHPLVQKIVQAYDDYEAKNQAKDRQRGERKNPQEKRQPRKREW